MFLANPLTQRYDSPCYGLDRSLGSECMICDLITVKKAVDSETSVLYAAFDKYLVDAVYYSQ